MRKVQIPWSPIWEMDVLLIRPAHLVNYTGSCGHTRGWSSDHATHILCRILVLVMELLINGTLELEQDSDSY